MHLINAIDDSNRTPRRYRFGVAAVSTLALAAMLPQAALAQAAAPAAKPSADETPPAEESAVTGDNGEIIVSGIRFGLAKSINIKRNETSIVEAVSAEEIGKLPDVSIAESIARLPGLAAQRVNGRAQVISLRGLAPDFTTTLLNGRQQASSGDNRSVEFDQYPSELLSSVVIYKTPDAHISGMGLAGSADLRTVRPLTYGKRTISMNLRGEMEGDAKLNADVKKWGWRGSLSYIDQNADGTLGWAVGFAHLDSPSQTKHYKAYNYETFCCGQQNRITPVASQGGTFLTGQEIFATSKENKRDAAIGILEWQPSDSVHSTLDLYYSRFKQREVMRGAQWFSNVWADAQTFTNVATTPVGGTNLATSGTANGVGTILRNDYNTRDDELFAVGLNNEFKLDDRTRFIADLSYSRNKRDESITETYAGMGCCATSSTQNANRVFDNLGWNIGDLLAGTGFPTYSETLNYADASKVSLGDRAPWGGWGHDGQTKQPHVKENVWSIDMGLDHDLGGFITNVEAGINYTHRDKNKRVDEFDLMLKNGRTQTLVGADALVSPTSLGFASFGNVLSVNLPVALPLYYNTITFINNDTYDKSWKIDEDVMTVRFKANIEDGPLRGNVGVQIVNQRQSSSGTAINKTLTPTQVLPYRDGATYTDVLPSINLIYDFGNGHRLRAAYAKTMARPRMDDLRANFTPSFGNPCGGSPPCVAGQIIRPWSASGGNPKLEPWRANAFDVAYEWYIGKNSYFSIAGFYKKLDTYIYTQRLPFDFTGLPIPANTFPAGVIISPVGQIDQPANGKGGSIKGIEISGALEFNKISSMLDGFGAIASWSYTKSDLKPLAPVFNSAGVQTNVAAVQATRIPGLSGTVYNITGYYEKNGFQARASYRFRSAFKGEVTQLFAVRGATEILADRQLDAQIGYTFPETSSMNGLGILLQVNNLTNSAYRTRLGVDGGGAKTADGSFLPETYEKYGRQFLFGVSYKY